MKYDWLKMHGVSSVKSEGEFSNSLRDYKKYIPGSYTIHKDIHIAHFNISNGKRRHKLAAASFDNRSHSNKRDIIQAVIKHNRECNRPFRVVSSDKRYKAVCTQHDFSLLCSNHPFNKVFFARLSSILFAKGVS